MKIHKQLKTSLYNKYLTLAFTHYKANMVSEISFCFLFIFNYPNSDFYNLDIIPVLYSTNKNIENDFSFNFDEFLKIDNNLFGLVYKGTKITNIPKDIYLINTKIKIKILF